MMRLHVWCFGATLALSVAALPVAAQPAPVVLTIDDAIARGISASRRLAELEARQSAAGAVVQLRRAADRPLLAAQAGYSRTNHIDEFGVSQAGGQTRIIFPDVPDNYRTRLDLQWPIYTSGRTDALERAARAEFQAAGKDLEAARGDLRLEITRGYWALVTAGDTIRVLDAAVAYAEAQLRDVRTRLDAGLIPPNEVLSVEAERSHQQLLLIEARNTREVTAADLRRLIGLEADVPIEAASPLADPGRTAEPVNRLIATGLATRPERQALQSRMTAATAVLAAAVAGRRPTFAVAGGVDYARPNPSILPRQDAWRSSWDLGLNVSWALWDGGRADAAIAEATANRDAVREQLEDVDRVIALEIRQRRLDLESARAATGAAADAVRSAAEARRVVGERFDAGVATSLDALDAQVALLRAELELTRARANVRLAEARLERAIGGT